MASSLQGWLSSLGPGSPEAEGRALPSRTWRGSCDASYNWLSKRNLIYVASRQVYGGQNRMAPLRNMFPNLITKEELATQLELDEFRKHVTSLAALDFLVCLKSDVFVRTHGGNFAKMIIGHRRYMGHRLKSIKPDEGLMSKSLGDHYMGWATFVEDVIITHQTRTRLPEETFPNYDIWESPLTPCMCRT